MALLIPDERSVLVLGVSGYIGGGVAAALRRGGYRVYGLIRNKDNEAQLLQKEIIPMIGYYYHLPLLFLTVQSRSITDFGTLLPIVKASSIFVDAIGILNSKMRDDAKAFLDFICKTKGEQKENQQPLYIFTSGWVYQRTTSNSLRNYDLWTFI